MTSPMAHANANREQDFDLEAWVSAAYEQEVAEIASAQRWGDYQLEFQVRIPTAVQHLNTCRIPLTITGRDHHDLPIGNLKRAVLCQDPEQPWRINITIRSHLTLNVVVVKQPIERGASVTRSMVQLESRTLNRGQSVLTQLGQIDAQRATRRLRAGHTLLGDHLEAMPLVMKGDEVVLLARRDGFQASMKGIALEEGAKGEQIEVQNLSSGKVVRATVTDKNQVQTHF